MPTDRTRRHVPGARNPSICPLSRTDFVPFRSPLDLFNTSLALGGAKLPNGGYVDGVDQTAFLLADDGQSNREAVFMYSERSQTAIRWEEFKIHFKVFQTQIPGSNIDESTLVSTGLSPWGYKLYRDPTGGRPKRVPHQPQTDRE